MLYRYVMEWRVEDGGISGIADAKRDTLGIDDTVYLVDSSQSNGASSPSNRFLIVKDGLPLNYIENISHLGALGGYEILVANGAEDIPAWLRKIDSTVVFLDKSVSPGAASQFLLYLPFDYRIGVIEHDGQRKLIDNFSSEFDPAALGSASENISGGLHPIEPAPADTKTTDPTTPANVESWLAQFSHELRTPLNSILGFSDVLLSELFGDIANEKQKEYIENVRQSGQYLLDLINDILDYSAYEAGKLELNRDEIDIAATIRDCVRLFLVSAQQAQIDLSTDIQDHLPTLFADYKRIKQILFNLISNAVKFTPPGEVVIVGAHIQEENELDIFVSDTGIGMDKDGLEIAR